LVKRGKRVTILDIDPQGTVMKWRKRRERIWPAVSASDAVRLPQALAGLRDMDFILLDLPGRSGPDMTAGMRLADMILVPSRPLDIDIEASGETVAAAQRLGKTYAFAMTVAPPTGRRTKEFSDMLRARGYPVVPASITERLAYPDAISEGLGVAEYEPNGKAAAEISAFTAEILKGMK
jgi:chromosome partitioning protein